MTKRLILDSGAFSVWNMDDEIKLEDYLSFCLTYPGVSYYVNLDVIPGKAGNKRSVTRANIEESCEQGWRNYQRMIKDIPQHKVIPVFHQNDDIKYLDRYLNAGVKYIGISPANDDSIKGKIAWLKSIRRYLFDSAGRATVRTHGFAVTSLALMNFMPWHSVDSASWKQNASWGSIFLPAERNGVYDYTKLPLVMGLSISSPFRKKKDLHYHSSSPLLRERVDRYLAYYGMPMGKSLLVEVPEGYKKQRVENGFRELWYKRYTVVERPVEVGASNSFRDRARLNILFTKEVNKVVPVKHIYFAGLPMTYPCEFECGYRLFSYHSIRKYKNQKCLKKHIVILERRRNARKQRGLPERG